MFIRYPSPNDDKVAQLFRTAICKKIHWTDGF